MGDGSAVPEELADLGEGVSGVAEDGSGVLSAPALRARLRRVGTRAVVAGFGAADFFAEAEVLRDARVFGIE